MDRLPAIPIIANDPYFSYWLPGDLPTDAQTHHWAGEEKRILGTIHVDGKTYRFLGGHHLETVKTEDIQITPTRTRFLMRAGSVEMECVFWSPALPDDLDTLSVPITYADFGLRSLDGSTHDVKLTLDLSASLCYDGVQTPALHHASFSRDGLNASFIGRKHQPVLGHSGDHITIDWGYLFLSALQGSGQVKDAPQSLVYTYETSLSSSMDHPHAFCMMGYDDIASINYFGTPCKAWYTRTGTTLFKEMTRFAMCHDELLEKCCALDEKVAAEATAIGGDDYRLITAAAWRHTFAAHKLIVTPEGEMALLSKENDSNGCIGTVDVSYPSIPLFLKYCPELVNALARPVLHFASLPVWNYDFAPHDVGRYPHATGQVYALREARCQNGEVYPPFYLFGQDSDVYDFRYQMPVEECGNMLVMLYSAIAYGASDDLASRYADILDKWVRYLDEFGEDPGEQLCTDDFAGHLAHNINLSAKALVGVACYAKLLSHLGRSEDAAHWEMRAQQMADSFLSRADIGESGSPLTFDGQGWSMKYNLVWDLVLDLGLLPADFYDRETRSYLPRIGRYGLPLDSRADYTKSDWECWTARLAKDPSVRQAILSPIATYLRESPSRVAFSDWYDTCTGRYVAFIARSVQGGCFMPML